MAKLKLKYTMKGMIFYYQLSVLDNDAPLSSSYGVHNWLVFRTCYNVLNFNERNLYITEKLIQQDFRYHKLVKIFTIFFFDRYKELILKYRCTCKGSIITAILYTNHGSSKLTR